MFQAVAVQSLQASVVSLSACSSSFRVAVFIGSYDTQLLCHFFSDRDTSSAYFDVLLSRVFRRRFLKWLKGDPIEVPIFVRNLHLIVISNWL